MTYTATLLRAEIRAVSALLVVVLLLTLCLAAFDLLAGGAFWNGDVATRDLIRITAVGTLFTTLYGAPLYALAVWKGIVSWYVAATIGLAPAVSLLPLLWTEPLLTFAVGGCGFVVALLTHLSMCSNKALQSDAATPRR